MSYNTNFESYPDLEAIERTLDIMRKDAVLPEETREKADEAFVNIYECHCIESGIDSFKEIIAAL